VSAQRRALERLAGSIDDALELVEHLSQSRGTLHAVEPPASLLEQCVELCAQLDEARLEPVRTVHHLACTGGTLICKGLAAMPNVQLLSEADPLSPFARPKGDEPRFAPADLTLLALQSTRGAPPELLTEIFLGGFAALYGETVRAGQRLVVRDHAHGHFCAGPAVPERPTLRAILAARFALRSIVTVRHPLDSFLSLRAAGWVHFEPATFEEYCRRCAAFLDAYPDCEVVRYEDFLAAPQAVMTRVCEVLELPFSSQFVELFDVFRLTGESGRSGGVIEARPRRQVDAELAGELERSPSYAALVARLGYGVDS
jgi:hypothetical protein